MTREVRICKCIGPTNSNTGDGLWREGSLKRETSVQHKYVSSLRDIKTSKPPRVVAQPCVRLSNFDTLTQLRHPTGSSRQRTPTALE